LIVGNVEIFGNFSLERDCDSFLKVARIIQDNGANFETLSIKDLGEERRGERVHKSFQTGDFIFNSSRQIEISTVRNVS